MKKTTPIQFIYTLFTSAVSIYLADWLMDGITLTNFWGALGVAAVMALLNAFLKPLLMLISLPLILFSFGFFLLVINAVLLLLASDITPWIKVDGFWTAFWGSLLISLTNIVLHPPTRGNTGQNGNGGFGQGGGGFRITIHRGGDPEDFS